MQAKYDVIISGFGPSGSTAANLLARKGYKILALEKGIFPRKKVCAGGLTPKAIKLLNELGIVSWNTLKLDSINIKIIKGVKVIADELEYTGDFSNGFGASVNRSYFDELLAKRAIENNVRLLENVHAYEPIIEKGFVCGVKYKSTSGIEEAYAKVVLIAEGAASPLTRILSGFSQKYRVKAVNTLCEPLFENNSEHFEFYFSKKLLPGYFWVFPYNDSIKGSMFSAGFGVEKQMNLKQEYFSLHKKYLINRASLGKPETWVIPVDYPKKNCGDGWILLGDAAGLANPVTGEGIFYAIKSGEFAAITVDEALKKGSVNNGVLVAYNNLIDDRFKKEYNLCNAIKKLLPLGFHKQFFKAAMKKSGTLETFMSGEMNFNGITWKKLIRYLFISPLALILLAGCASSPSVISREPVFFPPADAYLHFSKAIILSNNWMHKEALAEYKMALDLDPNSEFLNQVLAKEYEQTGNHEESGQIYEKLAKISKNSKTLLSAASFFIERERFEDAEAICNKLIAENGNDPDPYFLLGNIYYKQDKPDKAIAMFNKVVEIDIKAETAYFNLGLAFGKKGDFAEAEKNYRKAYEVNPEYTTPIYALGLLFQIQGQPEKAIKEYKMLLEKDEFDSRAYKNIGLAYAQMKKYPDAIEALKKTVELDKNDTESLHRLALLFFQTKNYKDSILYTKKLLKVDKDFAEGWQILGSNQSELGLDAEAITSYEKYVEIESDNPSAYIYLSYLYSKDRNYAKMIELLENGTKKLPENCDLKLYLGGAYFETKNYAKAELSYRDVLKIRKDDERTTYSLGVLLERTGRYEEAVSTFKKVIALNPKNADALNYAGYICADKNFNLEEALLFIKDALKLQPGNGAFLDSLGWIYFRMGKIDEAEKEITLAAALLNKNANDDATVYEHLGDILQIKGKFPEAKKMYEKSLAIAETDSVRRKLDEFKNKK